MTYPTWQVEFTKEFFVIKGDMHEYKSLKRIYTNMIMQMIKSMVKENFGGIKPPIILNYYVINGEN
jgi:hypothetical protein